MNWRKSLEGNKIEENKIIKGDNREETNKRVQENKRAEDN